MSQPTFEPLEIVIRGKHDTGKTTMANLIRMYLEECGYQHVSVKDTPPLPNEDKPPFMDRFSRNRHRRPVHISVELKE